MKALILFWSGTGNTKKVAEALKEGLQDIHVNVTLKTPKDAQDEDYFNYDLVCVGSPSIQWHPAKAMDDFLKSKLDFYRKQGKIRPCAPKIPGKYALIFVTYSGPHTGIDEATPAGKYMRQFFEHIGFHVIDELYVLSEFHGSEENSTAGRMGDIRGKPTAEELQKISNHVKLLVRKILS